MKETTIERIPPLLEQILFSLIAGLITITIALVTWRLYNNASTIAALAFLIFGSSLIFMYCKIVLLDGGEDE